MTTLTPVGKTKRAAGRYIVWSQFTAVPVVRDGKLVGYDQREVWEYGKVKLKAGNLLHTEQHERVLLRDAYFVEPLNWPEYGKGAYKRLSREEMSQLLPAKAGELVTGSGVEPLRLAH